MNEDLKHAVDTWLSGMLAETAEDGTVGHDTLRSVMADIKQPQAVVKPYRHAFNRWMNRNGRRSAMALSRTLRIREWQAIVRQRLEAAS